MKMLRIKHQPYNSFCISADSNEELGKSFMRFQEFYESPNPNFRNKIFTIGQYKQWYTSINGAYTYESDWAGYNIPSSTLTPFLQGLFDPLIDEEKELLSFFYHTDLTKPFYIIGANSITVLQHELKHSLYYYNKSYRNKIDKLFKNNNKVLKGVLKYLKNMGYHNNHLYDELQAYILDGDSTIISQIKNSKIINSVHKIFGEVK